MKLSSCDITCKLKHEASLNVRWFRIQDDSLSHWVQVTQCLYRPSRTLSLHEVEAHSIFIQSAHEGGKFLSLSHRPSLISGKKPCTHFCWRLSRSEGHSAARRIKPLTNLKNLIWNRTHLPLGLWGSASVNCATGCVEKYLTKLINIIRH